MAEPHRAKSTFRSRCGALQMAHLAVVSKVEDFGLMQYPQVS